MQLADKLKSKLTIQNTSSQAAEKRSMMMRRVKQKSSLILARTKHKWVEVAEQLREAIGQEEVRNLRVMTRKLLLKTMYKRMKVVMMIFQLRLTGKLLVEEEKEV
jgi:hypothetical protein